MTPEISHYLQFFEDLHRQMGELIAGLPAEALNWRPVTGGDGHASNSLAALVTHVAGSERYWIGEVVGGRPSGRDREAEFLASAGEALLLQARLEEATALAREALAGLAPDSSNRGLAPERLEEIAHVRGRDITLRWALMHMLEHAGVHLGHMQLTVQLWQQGRAGKSPRWYERV
ncbi:MAG: DUF664 domain-containing protein [Chloroflexi bacterium]|nr:DUF664 domain-containing protein [Chloroflexota bacterium]